MFFIPKMCGNDVVGFMSKDKCAKRQIYAWLFEICCCVIFSDVESLFQTCRFLCFTRTTGRTHGLDAITCHEINGNTNGSCWYIYSPCLLLLRAGGML